MRNIVIKYYGDGTPFSRALNYNRKFNAALRGELTGEKMNFNDVLAAMGEYKSRGKGRGRNTGFTVAKAHRGIGSNKYKPHQGKQEIARRLARLEAAHG